MLIYLTKLFDFNPFFIRYILFRLYLLLFCYSPLISFLLADPFLIASIVAFEYSFDEFVEIPGRALRVP